jgi:hypothetical protein
MSLKQLTEEELKIFKKNKPLYKPYKSTRVGKKGMVYVKTKNDKKKLIHFGDSYMEDFREHKDKKRQQNYFARARGIKNKNGELTYKLKDYANYWAYTVLWEGKI